MVDLPERLTITVTIPPGNVSAGTTIKAISTIGLGVPGLVGPPPELDIGDVVTGAPGSPVVAVLTPVGYGLYTLDFSIPAGFNGVGVQSAVINGAGHLIVTLTNGTVIDAGQARGTDGTGTFNGPVGAVDGHVVVFDGPTGYIGRDGGALGTAASKNTGTGAGNIPLLDGVGKLDTATLPAIAITDVFPVASQAAMLALVAQRGDVAVRTDELKTYILSTNNPGTLADWIALPVPTDLVQSVAGLVGVISGTALKAALAIAIADVSGLQTALNGKQATLVLAAAADILAGTDNAKMVTALSLAGATAISASTGSGTWNPNFATQGTPKRIANGTSTVGAPTNGIEGRTYIILVCQDATGSRGWSFATNFDFGSPGTPTPSTGANKVDVLIATCLDATAQSYRASYNKAS